MERIGQNFLLFLAAIPAVGLCYSFGIFWALDPFLFRFFSLSDHLLNAASLGPFVVTALIFLVPPTLFMLSGYYLSQKRIRRLAKLRLLLDRLPTIVLGLGILAMAIFHALPLFGRTAAFLGIAAFSMLLISVLGILAQVSFRRLHLAPKWFFTAIYFVSIGCLAITFGSVEGELARLGRITDRICAVQEGLDPQACAPVIIYGSELTLLSNGQNSVQIIKTSELEFRVILVRRAH